MLKPSIETHNVNGILVAEFWESLRLDPAPVQDLRGHFEAHLKNHGTADVVIDLSGVGFAGSAALGNFVALQRLVRAKGGRIVFCNVDPTVSEVFRASKLDSLFEFATDRADAVRAISERLPTASSDRKAAAGDPAQPVKSPGAGRSGSGPLRRRNHGQEST
jgi:anti-anti-sigma factor